jgi:hypothetical protein
MTADANNRRRRRVSVYALVIPADENLRCDLRPVTLTTEAFSDAIGVGLLDEAQLDTLDGHSYTIYADADRHEHHQPPNPRAITLATHLGRNDLTDRYHLHGDILVITGADDHGNDTDLPYPALHAATQAHLLPPK